MATQLEIANTYDWMTDFFLTSLGKYSDITNAFFNGNYLLSLDEAQSNKHHYIMNSLNLRPNDKVLDIGCGWGPFLYFLQNNGMVGDGLTLSPAQHNTCRKAGLEVHLKRWQDFTPKTKYDGIVAIGSPEHFCSIEEYEAGLQLKIFRAFFKYCHENSKEGSSLFLQSMLFPDHNVPNSKEIPKGEYAPKDSVLRHFFLLSYFYPGSWLPTLDLLKKAAEGYYFLESHNDGTLDYIETMKRWREMLLLFQPLQISSWKKVGFLLKLFPKFLQDRAFRLQIFAFWEKSNRRCFELNAMIHTRSVFKRIT
ncbi:MAG: SAM-dependent methyltransferase [Bacteroidia bacterium]